MFPLPDVRWIATGKYDKLKPDNVGKYACLNSRITDLPHLVIGDHVVFSTSTSSIILELPPNKATHTDTWISRESIGQLENNIVHPSEVLAHCAWMRYGPGQISKEIDYETFALVCLDR
ncbi:hypothetical protein VP01_4389g1 [Puccinia sorghi]|uniref:Uncharacterized protein n=1 Tax=Puccinia sorghi TaxID=27349 RepID=A0A0L6UPP7_9BASI|nr:hypothetical protein VP01_4389g1 [Puccinia sorghi]